MGKFERDKGKRGELELSRKLRELGFQDAHRSQQFCGSTSSADLLGIPQIHAEVKRCESLSLYKAFAQAENDSAGTDDMPTVFHRRNGKQWLVVISLEDWVKLYKGYMRQDQM